jgi:D-alanyl-D-alanine dipeptidase
VLSAELPPGFVYLRDVAPEIQVNLRYYSKDNFLGVRVNGYEKPVCIVTDPAAHALSKVQEELATFGLGLLVYDAYRPQSAVDHFWRWAQDLADKKMKADYYPQVEKTKLFEQGYIAARSGHSRGSSVDVTIVSLSENSTPLDMGTRWDFFDPSSWSNATNVTAAQRAHRMLLQKLMTKHGFEPLKEEWWHFKLKDEPFPGRYFDFPVE